MGDYIKLEALSLTNHYLSGEPHFLVLGYLARSGSEADILGISERTGIDSTSVKFTGWHIESVPMLVKSSTIAVKVVRD